MKNTSVYNKVREIINTSAKTENTKISRMAEIIQEKPEYFVYYKKNEMGVVKEFPCSTSSIRRKIRFCISLGLLDNEDNCSLTEEGTKALDLERFDYVLQQRILEFLERNGVSWHRIKNAIEKLPLPSPSNLYKSIRPNLSEETFRTCMFLLSTCGESIDDNILKHYQQKLYLTREKYEIAMKS